MAPSRTTQRKLCNKPYDNDESAIKQKYAELAGPTPTFDDLLRLEPRYGTFQHVEVDGKSVYRGPAASFAVFIGLQWHSEKSPENNGRHYVVVSICFSESLTRALHCPCLFLSQLQYPNERKTIRYISDKLNVAQRAEIEDLKAALVTRRTSVRLRPGGDSRSSPIPALNTLSLPTSRAVASSPVRPDGSSVFVMFFRPDTFYRQWLIIYTTEEGHRFR